VIQGVLLIFSATYVFINLITRSALRRHRSTHPAIVRDPESGHRFSDKITHISERNLRPDARMTDTVGIDTAIEVYRAFRVAACSGMRGATRLSLWVSASC